jgi:hypothetical protein
MAILTDLSKGSKVSFREFNGVGVMDLLNFIPENLDK